MKTKLSPAKRFWLLLKPDKLEIRNLYIYAVIIGLLNLVLPIGVQSIINLIQGGAVSTSWVILIIFVAGAIALSGFLQINQLRITESLQQKIFTRAAFEFSYRIPRVKLEELFTKYAPELMNRFFDVVSIQKGMTKILIEFSSATIQVFFGLILLSLYHPFFIIFSLLLVLLIYLVFWLTMRRGLITSLEESKHKYKLVQWLEEMALSHTTFKLSGDSDLTMKRTDAHAVNYINARESHFRILRFQYSLMIIFKVLVAVGLLLIGGLLVIDQQMNIGQFVAAEIVILLIVNSVEKIILGFETIYDVLTSLEKIGQVVDLELEKDGGLKLNDSSQGLRVKITDLSYTYDLENKKALDRFNLVIESEDRVLVSGQSDSGKSTLLHLLSGLLTPTSGSITIDDAPIGNYRFDSLRNAIGGNLRDESVFEGTLLENITLGRDKATFENVQWAIKSLGLNEWISSLPMGYDTQIVSAGKNLSKSTISKILIARSIVHKPRLLLFENSFVHLSHEDKSKILSFLLGEEQSWTIVVADSSIESEAHWFDRKIIVRNGQSINL